MRNTTIWDYFISQYLCNVCIATYVVSRLAAGMIIERHIRNESSYTKSIQPKLSGRQTSVSHIIICRSWWPEINTKYACRPGWCERTYVLHIISLPLSGLPKCAIWQRFIAISCALVARVCIYIYIKSSILLELTYCVRRSPALYARTYIYIYVYRNTSREIGELVPWTT